MRSCQEGEASTRRGFAIRFGTTRTTFAAMETGRSFPCPKHLAAPHSEFGANPNFILLGLWQHLRSGVVERLAEAAEAELEDERPLVCWDMTPVV